MLSILFYIYLLVVVSVMFALSVVAWVVCAPFDAPRRVVHELSRTLCMLFWHFPFAWRIRVEGLENIDRNKAYVMTINHNSMADIIAMYFLPLNFRWVSKREVFRIPVIGQLLTLHGDITIDRSRGADAMNKVIADGRKWIGRGASIAIFPEGTRSKDGEIARFKHGAFSLAKEAGVPILPVVVDGTRTMMKGMLFNWRNRLTIKVLPPVPADVVASTEQTELADMTRTMMVEGLAQVRRENAGTDAGR